MEGNRATRADSTSCRGDVSVGGKAKIWPNSARVRPVPTRAVLGLWGEPAAGNPAYRIEVPQHRLRWGVFNPAPRPTGGKPGQV